MKRKRFDEFVKFEKDNKRISLCSSWLDLATTLVMAPKKMRQKLSSGILNQQSKEIVLP